MSRLPTLGFIGTGVMGHSMAAHLLRAGYPLHVHNRTRSKAEPLLEMGAHWQPDAGTLAAHSECVLTMLGYPADVEATYLGAGGILDRAKPGTLLIDLTTSSPLLAQRVALEAKKRGMPALDAPVSGGDIGAREARLVIMVGGEDQAFERALPVLERLGKNIRLHGPPGSGQHCKMANQIAVAVGMVAWCEALAYAHKSGLAPEAVLQSISGGAAGSWALTNLAPRALGGDFAPGFYVKHILKDMGIALESAAQMQLNLPGMSLARALYEQVASKGWEALGTQALFQLYTSL